MDRKFTFYHFFGLIWLGAFIAALIGAFSMSGGQAAAQEPPVVGADIGAAAAQGTAFTYQGQLKRSGSPHNGTCSFRFSLFDAASGGTQVGSTQTINGVNVVNGLFTVLIDFGAGPFTGDARWLETAVQCAGDAGFTPLTPRQPLTVAPYALSLRPGAVISGTGSSGLVVNTPNGNAIIANGKANGYATVYGGDTSPSGGYGVYGSSGNGIGVEGVSSARAGVLGITYYLNGSGVEGNATGSNAAGVYGVNTIGPGVWGRGTSGGSGVFGESAGYAVYGASSGGFGVYGTSSNGGVVGVAYVGVQGNANGTTDSQGVRGDNGGSNTNGYAGLFNGRVSVFGNLTVFGTLAKSAGAFKIDHPLDPANKYLSHSFVESPDMKNIYDGVVTLNANGEAVVQLPDWFEALNQDFRYQLTCIGGYAPVYIAGEIANNQFEIGGGTPGLKVSWQVTGIRHDAYANANRIQVEEDKPAQEKGTYLYPELYGLPSEKGLTSPPPVSVPPGVTLPDQSQPTR